MDAVDAVINPIRKPCMLVRMQFHSPLIQFDTDMTRIVIIRVESLDQRAEESLRFLKSFRSEQEVHIARISPLRPCIALPYPLAFHQHEINPGLIQPMLQISDESIHRCIPPLQLKNFLQERDGIGFHDFHIRYMFQSRCQQTHDGLLDGKIVNGLEINGRIRLQPNLFFPETGPQQREKYVCNY